MGCKKKPTEDNKTVLTPLTSRKLCFDISANWLSLELLCRNCYGE